ncbi:MAG: type 4a pilus biogenesis protein PilO [Parcubacteria group bacterium]|jgi:Tfp pilus assembly protein PilO|nr:type 4a pilus biogenesis protein PilO [Parcubacteria group bacterium]
MNSWIPKNIIVKLTVGMVVLSVLLYLTSLFFVTRQTKKVENLYVDMKSKSFESEKIQAIKSTLGSYNSNLQILRDFFVKKGDEVKFIEEIERVAKDADVKFEISAINVKSGDEQSLNDDIDVRMEIEGPWNDVIKTIDNLERLPFGVLVDNLNINTVGGEGYWSGSISFRVFKEK